MFTITLDPIIAHIGPLVLRWYSLILIVGIGSACMLETWVALSRSPGCRCTRLSARASHWPNCMHYHRRCHGQTHKWSIRICLRQPAHARTTIRCLLHADACLRNLCQLADLRLPLEAAKSKMGRRHAVPGLPDPV